MSTTLYMDDEILHMKNLCHQIHNSMDVDIEMYNSDMELLHRNYRSPYPDGLLLGMDQYLASMKEMLDPMQQDSIFYHHLDSFFLVYINLRVQKKDRVYYLNIGPFLTHTYSDELVRKVLESNHYSIALFQPYRAFYSHLRYFGGEISDIAVLAARILKSDFPDDLIPIAISHQSIIHHSTPEQEMENMENTHDDVLNNYAAEKIWREAIKTGDYSTVEKAFQNMSSGEFLHRTPGNPLRSQKNLLIAVNTLCRAAAADAGADVLRIHQLSENYAIAIEHITNAVEVSEMYYKMFRSYCELTASGRTVHGSPVVEKAIQYLYAYYQKPLTLESVAGELGVSTGHLSRKFNAETGQTLGQYLNTIRIKEAISMLKATPDLSITDAALLVGFSSYAQFSVIFKKVTGKSAREYLAGIRH